MIFIIGHIGYFIFIYELFIVGYYHKISLVDAMLILLIFMINLFLYFFSWLVTIFVYFKLLVFAKLFTLYALYIIRIFVFLVSFEEIFVFCFTT